MVVQRRVLVATILLIAMSLTHGVVHAGELPLNQRKEIFTDFSGAIKYADELVERRFGDRPKKSELDQLQRFQKDLVGKYEECVQFIHKLSRPQLTSIIKEGRGNNWPIPAVGKPPTNCPEDILEEALIFLQGKRHDKGREMIIDLALAGFSGAYLPLGVELLDNPMLPGDQEAAYDWIQRAADEEVPGSFRLLADLLYSGLGCSVDKEKARKWYERSAGSGDPDGIFMFGKMALYGEGGQKNIKQGMSLMAHAATLGHQGAANYLQTIRKQSTFDGEWKLFSVNGSVPRDEVIINIFFTDFTLSRVNAEGRCASHYELDNSGGGYRLTTVDTSCSDNKVGKVDKGEMRMVTEYLQIRSYVDKNNLLFKRIE
jgi:hypothetical protein